MTAAYCLHYAPDNASLVIRMVLEALQVPYETVLVDRSKNAQKDLPYIALNPNGLIPTLETPDGPVFETGAIALWLADKHGALAPQTDSPDRAPFLKWLFFTSNTLHAGFRMLFYPEKFAGPDDLAQRALSVQMVRVLDAHLKTLDTIAQVGHIWFAGPIPGVIDYYVVACLRWMILYPREKIGGSFDLRDYPGLLALASHIETRPEAQAACKAEGLGPTPFSAPRHAQPAEGSVS